MHTFLWPLPQRKSFAPEALYIVCSCDERDKKRYSCHVPRPKATIRFRNNAKTQ